MQREGSNLLNRYYFLRLYSFMIVAGWSYACRDLSCTFDRYCVLFYPIACAVGSDFEWTSMRGCRRFHNYRLAAIGRLWLPEARLMYRHYIITTIFERVLRDRCVVFPVHNIGGEDASEGMEREYLWGLDGGFGWSMHLIFLINCYCFNDI